jgi:hypothetical protein
VRTAQVELVELVAHDFGAALRGAVADELIIEKLEPAAVDFFCFWRGMRGVVFRCHTDWTIHHEGGTLRVGARELGVATSLFALLKYIKNTHVLHRGTVNFRDWTTINPEKEQWVES